MSGLCVIRGVDTRSTGAVGVSGVTRAVRAQDVRPLCESWAVWADNRLSGIAAAWKAAVAAPPVTAVPSGATAPFVFFFSFFFPFFACSLRRLPRDFSISHPTQAYLFSVQGAHQGRASSVRRNPRSYLWTSS